ncbi:hypothetical protein GCM10010276_11480 [Streptomyces longisporus]|uniref:Uncharacterized protein n=1 Tax=Streptomyces longisporus TaxID=1948 RepID=A0ABN3L757_STRLO
MPTGCPGDIVAVAVCRTDAADCEWAASPEVSWPLIMLAASTRQAAAQIIITPERDTPGSVGAGWSSEGGEGGGTAMGEHLIRP